METASLFLTTLFSSMHLFGNAYKEVVWRVRSSDKRGQAGIVSGETDTGFRQEYSHLFFGLKYSIDFDIAQILLKR